MEELKKLYEEQAEAYKAGDFVKLGKINNNIFILRQKLKKQKEKAKEEQQDEETHKKIDFILNKE